jgi:tetratricopeptide (TPR) repeat protein
MQGRQSAKATLLLFAVAGLLWSTIRASGDTLREQEAASASFASLESLSPELRGDLLMIRRQYLSAINAYRSAPRDSAVISNKLGIAYHHVYALDQAKMEYQKALLLRPNYPEAINNLGAVYYAEKDYKRAERLYRHSLKLNPRSATAYSNLGTAYFTEGKTKQGIAAYRNAFALDPLVFAVDPGQMISETTSPEERARLDFCLAEIYARAGMDDRALALLRKAVDEGFKDSKRLMQAPEFAQLRKTAEFAQLMALEKQP